MVKLNKKEVISLVNNDFIPLEESKEGLLKGGFGSVIQSATPLVTTIDNCPCNKDNCDCPDGGCWLPYKDSNNCSCGVTTPTSTPSIPTGPISPTDPVSPTTPEPTFPSLTDISFVF